MGGERYGNLAGSDMMTRLGNGYLCGSFLAATATLLAVACSTDTDPIDTGEPPVPTTTTPIRTDPAAVSRNTFDGEWPLTVDHGRLRCEPPSILLFVEPGGTKRALNGTALMAGYPWINPIWKRTPNQLTPKVYIGDLMDAARKLCGN